jgi:uncharacterized integral membrane protein (TIGR00698 family)
VAGIGLLLARVDWLAQRGLGALTLALMLGILLGNTFYPRMAGVAGPGVGFAKQSLLRLGVVLYGLRLTLHDIGQVGMAGVLVDALMLSSTFAMAYVLGTRWLGLDRTTSVLIGAGSAICGAAAVMATEPVVRAPSDKVAVAISTVVVFGTLATFLYPQLYLHSGQIALLPHGAHAFGLYAGSTIHEVAQVVAAARQVGQEAADAAVIAKMVRVMMLAPFLLWLSSRQPAIAHTGNAGGRLAVPWFAFLFIGVVLGNSLLHLPGQLVATLNDIDTGLLAIAMAALGMTTQASAIRQAGIKPLILAGVLFGWLVLGGALINHMVAT